MNLRQRVLIHLLYMWICIHMVACESHVCENNFPYEFDVGFYWSRVTAAKKVEWTKSCPELNVTSASFDPARKTLLMVHGLQPNLVDEEIQFGLDGQLDEVVIGWLVHGYNVGVFIWTCFADDSVVNFIHSENQIYTIEGARKMRYTVKTRDGDLRVRYSYDKKTVTDYFVDQWKYHFTNDRAYPEVRIIGHSLGAQLALHSAYTIYMDETIAKKPDRLAMLDAVMSPLKKMYLHDHVCGETISLYLGCMVKTLNVDHNLPIEYYKSSFINKCLFSSNAHIDIIKYTAFSIVEIHLWGMHPIGSCWDDALLHHTSHIKEYASALSRQINWQHIIIVPYYLMTMIYPAHRCTLSRDETTCAGTSALALGAAMPSPEVLAWSRPPVNPRDKLCFHHFDECAITGRPMEGAATMTITSADDLFFLRKCVNTKN